MKHVHYHDMDNIVTTESFLTPAIPNDGNGYFMPTIYIAIQNIFATVIA